MDTTRPSAGERIARFLGGVLLAAALGYGAFILLFIGVITTTGCFIECSDPNPLAGIPLLAGSVASAAAGVTSVAWGIMGGPLRRLWPVFAGSAAIGIGILVVGSLI